MSNSHSLGISTLAKKFIIALSGLGLVVYVILHLLGNLTLYRTEGTYFNKYAAQLHGFGTLLTVAEVGLLVVFLAHILGALTTKKKNLEARPVSYRKWRSKGGHTPSNISSRNMVITGVILLAFTVLHVWQFRFGPGIEQGYVVTQNGEEIRDLYKLVVEILKNPFMAVFYMIAMFVLGLHLRHGIWSAFQSMGWTTPRATRNLRLLGAFLGVILAVGFFLIPVWVYFGIQI